MSKKNAILTIVILGLSMQIFSQKSNIVHLLNSQLKKELSMYRESNFDSLKIIQPFHIDHNKKLVLEVEKYIPHMDRWKTIKSEVPLHQIAGLLKDVNVLFLSNGENVLMTVKTFNKKRVLIRTDIKDTNLFFTEINKEQNNKKFRNQLVAAFKKAGYEIKSNTWLD